MEKNFFLFFLHTLFTGIEELFDIVIQAISSMETIHLCLIEITSIFYLLLFIE